ncbi:MAG TPA: hypothetical protein VFZ87_10735 [Gemmatimonadales bacterium]
MPNPHWHGALLNDRCWYVVGWLMGLGIALGLLMVVDFTNFLRWFRTSGGGLGVLRSRLRRAYGGNVAVSS